MKSLEGGAETLTIFDAFATGYLSTRLRPRTFTQWIVWAFDPRYAKGITAQTFASPDRLPDLLPTVTVTGGARRYWERYFKDSYFTIRRNSDRHAERSASSSFTMRAICASVRPDVLGRYSPVRDSSSVTGY